MSMFLLLVLSSLANAQAAEAVEDPMRAIQLRYAEEISALVRELETKRAATEKAVTDAKRVLAEAEAANATIVRSVFSNSDVLEGALVKVNPSLDGEGSADTGTSGLETATKSIRGEIRTCLDPLPMITLRVDVRFYVDSTGRATYLGAKSADTLPGLQIARECLSATFARTPFPLSTGKTYWSYAFLFN